jgi:hypothetical protein
MEIDLRYKDSVVFSSKSGMFRFDLNDKVIDPMLDADGQNMINISWFPRFAQMDEFKLLLVDGAEHCLKLFIRNLLTEPVSLISLVIQVTVMG